LVLKEPPRLPPHPPKPSQNPSSSPSSSSYRTTQPTDGAPKEKKRLAASLPTAADALPFLFVILILVLVIIV
jgi:hypothetical protein